MVLSADSWAWIVPFISLPCFPTMSTRLCSLRHLCREEEIKPAESTPIDHLHRLWESWLWMESREMNVGVRATIARNIQLQGWKSLLLTTMTSRTSRCRFLRTSITWVRLRSHRGPMVVHEWALPMSTWLQGSIMSKACYYYAGRRTLSMPRLRWHIRNKWTYASWPFAVVEPAEICYCWQSY